MEMIYAAVGTLILFCFFLQWLVLPITTALRKKWIWALTVFVAPLSFIVAFQSGRLKSPSWREWLIRVGLAGVVAVGLVYMGGSSWINSPTMHALKGQATMLFSTNIDFIDGRMIRTLDGDIFESSQSAHLAPSAFAVAALAVVAGAMQFYGPVVKSIFLAIFFFLCAFLTTMVTHGLMAAAFADKKPSDVLGIMHSWQTAYNFHLWYLVMFGAALLWAASDIRHERNSSKQAELPIDSGTT